MKTTMIVMFALSLLACRPQTGASEPLGEGGSAPRLKGESTVILGPARVLRMEFEAPITRVYLDAPYPPDTVLKFFEIVEFMVFNPLDPFPVIRRGISFQERGLVIIKKNDGKISMGHLINGPVPFVGDLAYPPGIRPPLPTSE